MREASLKDIYVEAKRVYPGVALSQRDFERHSLALCSPDVASWAKYGPDLFLSIACGLGVHEAILIVERDVLPAAAEAVARVRPAAEFVEAAQRGLVQKLIYDAPPKIAEYSAKSSLVAWVKVVATRYALQQLGSGGAALGGQPELAERLIEHYFRDDAMIVRGKYAELFQQAIAEAVTTLEARDRNVLRMHLLGNCSVDQIGRAYSVNRATAAQWLSSTKNHLFESVSRRLRERDLELSDEEFDNVAQLVQNQLDLTFAQSATGSSQASSNG